MARLVAPITTLVPQQSVASNLTPVGPTGNGEWMFLNDGSCMMQIQNGSTGQAAVVTVYAVPDEAGRTGTGASGLPFPNASQGYQVNIPFGQSRFFGPFRQAWWNQTATDVGYVYVDIDSTPVAGTYANMRIQIINF